MPPFPTKAINMKFHLAFPCHDFSLAKEFYQQKLGFELGRESENALIINCGDNQLVAHRCEQALTLQKSIYPRHFGLIFDTHDEFQGFIDKIKQQSIEFHIAPKIRFANTRIEHHSFFLLDPSNNLLEFKHYTHDSAIFDESSFKQIGES